MNYEIDEKYCLKNGIEITQQEGEHIAVVPSSYSDDKKYYVRVGLAAEWKRKIISQRVPMEGSLTDRFYDSFPYDVANFIICGLTVFP